MEELDFGFQARADGLTSQEQTHRVPGRVLSTSMQDLSRSHSSLQGYSPGFTEEKTKASRVRHANPKCQRPDLTPGCLAPEPSLLITVLYFAKDLDLGHWVGVIRSS